MELKHITYRKSRLTYYVIGNGQPVLLMHGFAEDHSIWQHQTEILKNKYRLIIPDLFGTCSSEQLHQSEVSIVDYAHAIKEIVVAESISKFIMIGHSMGGYITLAYLRDFPEDLIAIGLVHSTIFADDENKKETRKKAIQFIQEHGGASFLKTSIPGLFRNSHVHETIIQSLIKKSFHIHDEALVQYYQAMLNRPDSSELISNTKISVMIIAGKHDNAVPFSQSSKQFHLCDTTYLKILHNAAHMGMLEETEEVNKFLSFFISNQYQH